MARASGRAVMGVAERQLTQRWHGAQDMPRGRAQFAAMDAVIREADAAGLAKWALQWRLAAMHEYHHGGDPARTFLAFSQALSAVDSDPSLLTGQTEYQLLWRFKWVIWAMPQFPAIPLERAHAVLNDMQERYLRSGRSLHAVYQHRWLVAHHTGDPAAETWYQKMVTAGRDEMSDCAHCVPSSQVRHLVTAGRDEEAIRVGAPFTRGGCVEQPHWMLSELLLPYVRTGQMDAALEAHQRGYATMRNDRHHLDNIAAHVYYCGLSGREPRGLELTERHWSWLSAPSSPYAAMEFAAAAASVLRRLIVAGHGDKAVRSPGGSAAETVSTAEAELTQLATSIAADFDARNGNTHQSTRIFGRIG